MQMSVSKQCREHGPADTGREHREPRLDLIKYGTTNLAAIKFTVQVSYRFYAPHRNAGSPDCIKEAGVLP